MSDASAGPLCPRCRRRIAAWRMDHCIYCGATFPPDLKEGFAEPEALKWVDRPALPPEVARQLEMMKVVPLGAQRRPRSFLTWMAFLSMPVFAIIFYLLYAMVARYLATHDLPHLAGLILVGGAAFLVYLAWSLKKAAKKI